jgi:hypothetical protein
MFLWEGFMIVCIGFRFFEQMTPRGADICDDKGLRGCTTTQTYCNTYNLGV